MLLYYTNFTRMRIKSYRLLFHFFSFLSDKTNGMPLFVKYKVLLGTLILALASSSASKAQNKVTTVVEKPPTQEERITCYKPSLPKDVEIKGNVIDKTGKPISGVTVRVKGTTIETVTDIDGNFRIKAKAKDVLVLSSTIVETREIRVSKMKEPIVMEWTPIDFGSLQISCYISMPIDEPIKNDSIEDDEEKNIE